MLIYKTKDAAAADVTMKAKILTVGVETKVLSDDIIECGEDECAILLVRSGTGIKKHIKLVTDSGLPFEIYNNGEMVSYTLLNNSEDDYEISDNEALCQLVLIKKKDLNVLLSHLGKTIQSEEELSIGKERYFEVTSEHYGEINNSLDKPNFKPFNDNKGYYLLASSDVKIEPNEYIKIPLWTAAVYPKDEGLYLMADVNGIYSRELELTNGIGLIDSDYYPNSMSLALHNKSDRIINIKYGDIIGKAVFIKYLTYIKADHSDCKRTGGFGSTGK